MRTLAAYIATAPEEPMGRKHDDDPADRKRHIDVAVDRILHGMTVDEIRVRHRIGRMSVYRYIEYAVSYPGVVPEILRRAMSA